MTLRNALYLRKWSKLDTRCGNSLKDLIHFSCKPKTVLKDEFLKGVCVVETATFPYVRILNKKPGK